MAPRDAQILSFDCFGTLIDWESGIWAALAPLRACAIGRPAAVALQAAPWHEVRLASHPTQEALLAQLP